MKKLFFAAIKVDGSNFHFEESELNDDQAPNK